MAKTAGTSPTVAGGFVTGMLAGVQRAGLRREDLLDHAGIASEVLHRSAARVPVGRYAALYRAVNERLDDEAFALFSRPMRRGSFELLARGALSATTLDAALARISRHLRVLIDDFEVELERSGGSALLIVNEELTPPSGASGRVFAYEWLLRLIHGLAAWLVAHPLPLDEVAFPYPPPLHAADYDLVFAPRANFDAPRLEARFAVELLDLPVRRDEAALRAFLVEAPASITTLYRRDRALGLRVREALRAALPASPSLNALARNLHLSPRTLHRRLLAEGVSLRSLREGLRRELATDWLTKTTRPVAAIATDLGYADPATFFRAFRAWEGCGPRDYRQRMRPVRRSADNGATT